MAERTGLVTEYEVKEKGPTRCKVAGKVVKAWPTLGQDDPQPNPALEILSAASRNGDTVKVEGYEKHESYNGHSYTAFYATFAEIIAPPVIATSNGATGSHDKQYVGREPGLNDYWTAARWAVSTAVNILGAGKEVGEYEAAAKVFLASTLDLASKVQADTPKSGGTASEDW